MRNESLQFWQQVKNGDGQGVLANGN
jgi:hypothetical protein